MPTLFRQNLRSGLFQLLSAWHAVGSNALLVRQVHDHRPPKFDPPEAFIGDFVEELSVSGHVLQRNYTATVEVVAASFDNQEQLRLHDVIVDSLVEYLTARWHGVTANSLQEPATIADIAVDIGGVPYYVTRITIKGFEGTGRPSA